MKFFKELPESQSDLLNHYPTCSVSIFLSVSATTLRIRARVQVNLVGWVQTGEVSPRDSSNLRQCFQPLFVRFLKISNWLYQDERPWVSSKHFSLQTGSGGDGPPLPHPAGVAGAGADGATPDHNHPRARAPSGSCCLASRWMEGDCPALGPCPHHVRQPWLLRANGRASEAALDAFLGSPLPPCRWAYVTAHLCQPRTGGSKDTVCASFKERPSSCKEKAALSMP